MGTYTFQRAPSLALQERIVQALILSEAEGTEALTSDEISEAVFSSFRNVRRVLMHMVGLPQTERRVRISGWIRQPRGGEPTALFSVGSSPNAPRIRPYTPSEVCKRYRKANPEVAVRSTLTKRARRMKFQRDPLTVGLFGEAP